MIAALKNDGTVGRFQFVVGDRRFVTQKASHRGPVWLASVGILPWRAASAQSVPRRRCDVIGARTLTLLAPSLITSLAASTCRYLGYTIGPCPTCQSPSHDSPNSRHADQAITLERAATLSSYRYYSRCRPSLCPLSHVDSSAWRAVNAFKCIHTFR